ncbi:hypothetical protein KSF78_0000823 [Schistosoma japonicum]|nr:hypothetical protein KSF78_0000823 [Schistosoma japonicum]
MRADITAYQEISDKISKCYTTSTTGDNFYKLSFGRNTSVPITKKNSPLRFEFQETFGQV